MAFLWHDEGIKVERTKSRVGSPQRVTPIRPTQAANKISDDDNPQQDITDNTRSMLSSAYQREAEASTPRKKAVLAEEIMSSPVKTLAPTDKASSASQLISGHRFRHVPVVTPQGDIVGIVSDRNILILQNQISAETTVAEIMSKKVLTASPDTEIREIARVLFEERIGAMPIIDDEHRLCGIITRSDILRALISRAPLEIWI